MEESTELQAFNLADRTAKVKILTGQVAENIIEIGRTLLEVKENLSYGEFQIWLENDVNYSKSTAYNFIKVAKEFQDFQPVGKLGMRKLLALSGIEADDREKISTEYDLEKMTVKEVDEVVKMEKQIKKVNDFMDKLSQEVTQTGLDYSFIDFNIDPITNEILLLTPEQIEQEKKELEEFILMIVNKCRIYWYEPLNELRKVINNDKNFAHAVIGLNTMEIVSSGDLGFFIKF